MTTEEVILIAEKFNNWLEDMAKKYRWDKDTIQFLIKTLLQG
jgi:hypothetical protein